MRADPYGHSFITYNSTELRRKVSNWKRALPWITPYYAIKSNPIEPLINDIVAGPYGTFDCASKGVFDSHTILGNSSGITSWSITLQYYLQQSSQGRKGFTLC